MNGGTTMRPERNEGQYLADGGQLRAEPDGTHTPAQAESSGNLCWAVLIVGGLILALIALASIASGSLG
ncbi:MAG: hypothetical protein U9N78_09790 [Actinomycetota bacterium]|nr:hypothetical protein [Actinomycetota bacterium]